VRAIIDRVSAVIIGTRDVRTAAVPGLLIFTTALLVAVTDRAAGLTRRIS
jgi:hypothetical protein